MPVGYTERLVNSDITFVAQPPSIFVVGMSSPDYDAFSAYLYHRGESWNMRGETRPALNIPEAAGRVCYQSWSNPHGRTTAEYLEEQIIGHGHESVIEHLTFNLMVADLPRSTQLELVRHRVGVAYSFESTRYTDKHLRFVIPPAMRDNGPAESLLKTTCRTLAHAYRSEIEIIDTSAYSGTQKHKRAKEAARSILPNCQGSDGMVTLNGRAARHIITLRSGEGADLSMREFAVALFRALQPIAPPIFADMIEAAHPSGIPVIRKESNP